MSDAIDLNNFMQGYIEAMLWSTSDPDNGDKCLDARFTQYDLAPATLEQIRKDCEEFVKNNESDLLAYMDLGDRDASNTGHDLWLTSAGHGTGYWNRGVGDVGERLSKASKKYTREPYPGDDGLIYF